MLGWLVASYFIAELLLIMTAGFIALTFTETGRRKDAYKVLRLLITTGAASGLLSLLVRLHELGILRLRGLNQSWRYHY